MSHLDDVERKARYKGVIDKICRIHQDKFQFGEAGHGDWHPMGQVPNFLWGDKPCISIWVPKTKEVRRFFGLYKDTIRFPHFIGRVHFDKVYGSPVMLEICDPHQEQVVDLIQSTLEEGFEVKLTRIEGHGTDGIRERIESASMGV